MTADITQNSGAPHEKFVFCSSLAADVYQNSHAPTAYEWWYFDALSDDGRDALTIIFLDNFIFSPRYNSTAQKAANGKSNHKNHLSEAAKDLANQTPDSPLTAHRSPLTRFPALAFCLYRDGKPLYRAINEFSQSEFSAGAEFPSCRIGASDFQFEATPYGVRYLLNVTASLRGKRTLRASLEWLAIERDFETEPCARDLENSHFWNLAAPRADVTGKIEVFDRADNQVDLVQFRGTGYHDHNQDSRWLPGAVQEWQWGRAHFTDATAVFYRYLESGLTEPITKLFAICENKFDARDAVCTQKNARRHFFGVKYPALLDFSHAGNCSLQVKQTKIIDASFFYLRFLSEMRLDLGDGRTRETIGITEHLAPGSLRRRELDWLVNMRIGRNGRGAFLP